MNILKLFFKSVLITLSLSPIVCISQTFFIKSYGGPEPEIPGCLIQLPDSGFAIIGNTRSYGLGNQNLYLIRTNKNGDTLWTRASSNISGGQGNDILLTNENDLIISGQTWGSSNLSQLMKFDLQGNLIYSKGYVPNLGGYFRAIKKTNDNNFILLGNCIDSILNYQIKLMVIDSSGTALYVKTYGDIHSDMYTDFKTLNSGFIVTGAISCTFWPQLSYIFLMKLDNFGNVVWSRRYDNTPFCNIFPGSVVLTNDGGYALTGGFGINDDILVMRTDSLGNLLWTKAYGGNSADNASKIFLMPDNGFLIAGYSSSFNSAIKSQIYFIRTNALGDTLWTKCIGDKQNTTNLRDVIQTIDGGYAILAQSNGWNSTGTGDYDIVLLVLDSLLHSNCFDYNTSTIVTNVLLDDSSFIQPQYDYITQTFNSLPIFTSGGTIAEWCTIPTEVFSGNDANCDNFNLFPNPVQSELSINYKFSEECYFELLNVIGIKKMTVILDSGSRTKRINLTDFDSGVYFYSVVDRKRNRIKAGKLIVQKK